MLPIAALVLAGDQFTKEWALARLVAKTCESGASGCTDLVWGVKLRLVFNEGAAFSMGSGYGGLFGVAAFIIVGLLVFLALNRPDFRSQVILGVLAGGALGNLADRLFRAQEGFLSGAVVDFVDLGWWPVFNVADVAVVCGAIAAVFFLGEPSKKDVGEKVDLSIETSDDDLAGHEKAEPRDKPVS